MHSSAGRPATGPEAASTVDSAPHKTTLQRVAICGLGNIGGALAEFAARHAAHVRLIDSGRVEATNSRNQMGYVPSDAGRFKAHVLAKRLRRAGVPATIEARAIGLSDVPWDEWLDRDVIFGCLDSLEARRLLISERAWPAGKWVVDGGVGEQRLGGVKWIVPGDESACFECHWGPAHYRQATREYPCLPGADPVGPPTQSPAHLGALVAAHMTALWLRACETGLPELSGQLDLAPSEHRLRVSRLRRASACRFDHSRFGAIWRLEVPFETASVGDVLDALRSRYGADDVELTLPRRVKVPDAAGFPTEPPSSSGWSSLASLARCGLADAGFVPGDGVRVRTPRGPRDALLLLSPGPPALGGTR